VGRDTRTGYDRQRRFLQPACSLQGNRKPPAEGEIVRVVSLLSWVVHNSANGSSISGRETLSTNTLEPVPSMSKRPARSCPSRTVRPSRRSGATIHGPIGSGTQITGHEIWLPAVWSDPSVSLSDSTRKHRKTTKKTARLLPVALFLTSRPCAAQGPLTPSGAPEPTMKTLGQVDPRTPISSLPYTIDPPGSYYV